jgi:hypothetical protein
MEESSNNEEAQYIEFEEILSTNSPSDVALIKSLLDAENITYFLQGEHVAPYVYYAVPIRLMIRKDQVKRVLDILKDINLSITFGGQHSAEGNADEK